MGKEKGQTPFVRSTLRAVPAKGVCPLFHYTDPHVLVAWVKEIRRLCGRTSRSGSISFTIRTSRMGSRLLCVRTRRSGRRTRRELAWRIFR